VLGRFDLKTQRVGVQQALAVLTDLQKLISSLYEA
jgi:hypothetical protein